MTIFGKPFDLSKPYRTRAGDKVVLVQRCEYLINNFVKDDKGNEPALSLSYQERVGTWMAEVFTAGGADVRTRIDRLIEETFELAQALEYDPGRIAAIRDYVYGRPVGDPKQEMGGVMVTLASLACASGISMDDEGERELARIHLPEVKAKILAKQASKNGLHTPLPTAMAAAIAEGRTFPVDTAPALSPAREGPETGWLIEVSGSHVDPGVRWFSASRNGFNFTKDASAAIRFARKVDAEQFAAWATLDAYEPA